MSNLTKKEIQDLIDKSIDKQFAKLFKKEYEDIELYKDKEFKKEVRSISADVLDDFYRLMWTKKNFWKKSIVK